MSPYSQVRTTIKYYQDENGWFALDLSQKDSTGMFAVAYAPAASGEPTSVRETLHVLLNLPRECAFVTIPPEWQAALATFTGAVVNVPQAPEDTATFDDVPETPDPDWLCPWIGAASLVVLFAMYGWPFIIPLLLLVGITTMFKGFFH